MAKRGSSKARKNFKLFRRVYSPLNHLVSLTRNVGKNAFRTTGRLVNNGLGFVQRTGRGVVAHADGAITGVVRGTRRNRKNRKDRKTRKTRKDRR
jgi:hypothetical protein